jgi:hypothetical protein
MTTARLIGSIVGVVCAASASLLHMYLGNRELAFSWSVCAIAWLTAVFSMSEMEEK